MIFVYMAVGLFVAAVSVQKFVDPFFDSKIPNTLALTALFFLITVAWPVWVISLAFGAAAVYFAGR